MLYALDLYEDLTLPAGAPPPKDEPAEVQRGAMAELTEVYRQLGFDAGYAQATRDHLEMFVANAESVLQHREGMWVERDAARRLLYAFIARLERRMGYFAGQGQVDPVATGDHPLTADVGANLFAGGLGI